MKGYLRPLVLVVCLLGYSTGLDIDPRGYILYCPCMGRFGNQADHFLGALSFARGLNRTLVLPPWVEYRQHIRTSVQVPFDTYFLVEPLRAFTKVMTMEQFMRDLAPVIWPPAKRTVFCYSPRNGGKHNDCNAKDGNPFGSFWNTFNIDFVASEFYGGSLSYNVDNRQAVEKWDKKYPAQSHLVLAFTGAPASFPVTEQCAANHQYLQWSADISGKAERFIAEEIGEKQRFLGIHMRNGVDWARACEHAKSSPGRNMFGSAHCLGHRLEHGELTEELCLPGEETVTKQVKAAVKRLKAKYVFVATDNDDMIPKFQKQMKKVKFVKLADPNPHLDLAILARADHYIANCVSTFSTFAVRERRVNNRTNEFWAFKAKNHDEL